ncbi:transposase family protein [Actinomadura geliboluensis]|uniref:transposase family protein n=1 Tax=Actinomadura geliboluensis TaxID=882440 RepID=UPI00367B3EE7
MGLEPTTYGLKVEFRRAQAHRRRQALLVHLRRNETFARLAAAFGAATAHRHVTEVVDLLAALAPDPRQALRIARRKVNIATPHKPTQTS